MTIPADVQTPHLRWCIGSARITRIEEALTRIPIAGFFPAATPGALAPHLPWLRPHFVDAEDNAILSIHGLVVESRGRTILVDTCIGENWPADSGVDRSTLAAGPASPFLANLEAAGFARERIDVVLCTHLHFDHVGWNTMRVAGEIVPTFPNARYLFARAEWEHWCAQEDPGFAATLGATVAPILAAGLADLVEGDHVLTDEVRLEPTPGHTPGHVSVHVASQGRRALITGDMTHHPVQWAEPTWGIAADSDGAEAARTRQRLLAEHTDRDLLVIGTHYAPPTAGRLAGRAGRVRLEVA
jgi:glyoxylase-like metal-dependent hydrolase (beta-lactamase superfamily II)